MAQPRRWAPRPRARGLRRALTERRLDLGLTQFELADLAGVSRASLQRLEAGAPHVRLETLERVAAAMGCHIVLVDATGSLVEARGDA